ncbi:hypothetical protein [Thermotoga sp. SG1]|uniref:hypothetical protein n=1 Tax=Thermotoga sp. SG1 TaxID=126739 RepID=UPI000C758516|nr:hypothetical protein [Thermotoga sp. SG1]PLV56830.1 hypothetical protein AS006_04335 [Thermotoga sp. SG1]
MKKFVVMLLVFVSFLVFPKTIHIKADFVKPSEEEIEYSGNVFLEIEEESFTLQAESLVVRKLSGKWRITEASSSVTVTLEDGEISGESLVYDVETREGTITGNVVGNFQDRSSTETILVNCHELVFNLEENVFIGSGNVQIKRGAVEAFCGSFVYRRSDGIIELVEEVDLNDTEKNLKMKADKVVMDLEADTMEAMSVSVTLEVE